MSNFLDSIFVKNVSQYLVQKLFGDDCMSDKRSFSNSRAIDLSTNEHQKIEYVPELINYGTMPERHAILLSSSLYSQDLPRI